MFIAFKKFKVTLMVFLCLSLLLNTDIKIAHADTVNVGTWDLRKASGNPWQDYLCMVNVSYINTTSSLVLNMTPTDPDCGYYSQVTADGVSKYYLYNYDWYTGDGIVNSSRSPLTWNNIAPNTAFNVAVTFIDIHNNPIGNAWIPDVKTYNITLYTLAKTPYGIAFPSIEQNRIQLSWNNNGNPEDSSYTVQRKTDSSDWIDISTGTNISAYSDTGLQSETTYYYRIRVNQKTGTYIYSDQSWAATSLDPTISAARAAQSAAEQGKAASEAAREAANGALEQAQIAATVSQSTYDEVNMINNTVLSEDAGIIRDHSGSVLDAARASATNTYDSEAGKTVIDYVKTIDTKVNNLQQAVTPTITKITGAGGATCTTSDTFHAVVTTNPSNGGTLSATCSGPVNPVISISGNTITFNGLTASGAYTATITVSLGMAESQNSYTFFKI